MNTPIEPPLSTERPTDEPQPSDPSSRPQFLRELPAALKVLPLIVSIIIVCAIFAASFIGVFTDPWFTQNAGSTHPLRPTPMGDLMPYLRMLLIISVISIVPLFILGKIIEVKRK